MSLAGQPAPNPFAEGAAFVEGRYLPVAEARVPLLDWGFIKSDATYDVVGVWGGRLPTLGHLTPPMSR